MGSNVSLFQTNGDTEGDVVDDDTRMVMMAHDVDFVYSKWRDRQDISSRLLPSVCFTANS